LKRIKRIFLLEEVKEDIEEGKRFYEMQEKGLGDYFRDNIISDIESLFLYGGIHSKNFGLYRMLSKRFPYAIYYDIDGEDAIIVAVLHMKRESSKLYKNLKKRYSIK